jgi:hypothetical protein
VANEKVKEDKRIADLSKKAAEEAKKSGRSF